MTGRERRSWHPAGTDRAEAEAFAARLASDRLERAMPIISRHELRHTRGTLLIEAGEPVKVVTHAARAFEAIIALTRSTDAEFHRDRP